MDIVKVQVIVPDSVIQTCNKNNTGMNVLMNIFSKFQFALYNTYGYC